MKHDLNITQLIQPPRIHIKVEYSKRLLAYSQSNEHLQRIYKRFSACRLDVGREERAFRGKNESKLL